MKPSLKHFVNTIHVPVNLDIFTVNVQVDPDALTIEHFERLQAVHGTENLGDVKSLDAVVELCADMIQSWDLLENDEKTVVPITKDRLRKLKVQRVLVPIINAVFEAANPTTEEATS